ncbi:hypothetical protein COXBURSA334_0667 [Coxiella burnetii Q321]|nr:hypothetical protein COXBURSA334_0667 [Coxiella burnetii Q321]
MAKNVVSKSNFVHCNNAALLKKNTKRGQFNLSFLGKLL